MKINIVFGILLSRLKSQILSLSFLCHCQHNRGVKNATNFGIKNQERSDDNFKELMSVQTRTSKNHLNYKRQKWLQ